MTRCRPSLRALLASSLFILTPMAAHAADATLNVLTWCDHEDPSLLAPFEKAHNVKVHFKDIDSTGAALAVIGQSQPGDWDVLVLDETDTPRLAEMGLLAPLDPTAFPTADFFPGIDSPKLSSFNGKTYAVPEKFGYNTVAYNSTVLSAAAMSDIQAPWKAEYKDRIAIYDYYVPIVAYTALALGKNPATLSDADLPAIRTKLSELRHNAALVGDVTTTQQALATGQVDILVGGGEWVTAGMAKDRPNLTYLIPTQGGVRWQQGLAVFAGSQKKDLAVAFAQYILTPEAQGKLATSSCYWGMPANSKAVLKDEDKKLLQWDMQPSYIARTATYLQMTPAFDKTLQKLWTEVMQNE
ncbi:spermidine/putrescine-binding periplasmic protein [Acetobacter estunensis NRIC 0472]|uniref:Extracellular solute-binding protein n=1 Tax=Acetobacter estunensis TaxID=104097 RepID=A0A967EJE7_9PROT|nr:spermidine/putrescine ABC transporter substrate-binding protein [Acetobacter estunensis]NHO54909.1 extracellular solute-binding protein [Acetobacter estunensis]GBQ23971.1 spermidine/putrescine-binding periplasmic protein [Acetobacter estunensis NRIC 0472]